MDFASFTRVPDVSDGLQDTTLCRFFFSRLYLSDSIFYKDSLETAKVNDSMKRFFPNKSYHGNRKKTKGKGKLFVKNMNLIDTYYH